MLVLPRGLCVLAAQLFANVPTASAIQFFSTCRRGFRVTFDFVKLREQSQRAKGEAATEVWAVPRDARTSEGGGVEKPDRMQRNEPIRIGAQSGGCAVAGGGRQEASEVSRGRWRMVGVSCRALGQRCYNNAPLSNKGAIK